MYVYIYKISVFYMWISHQTLNSQDLIFLTTKTTVTTKKKNDKMICLRNMSPEKEKQKPLKSISTLDKLNSVK